MKEVLFNIIVERGQSNKILKELHKYGIKGGTTLFAEGSAPETWLDFLGFSKKEKELLMVITSRDNEDHVLELLRDEFKFDKKNTGIAYSMPIISHMNETMEYENIDYDLYSIYIVIEKGSYNKYVKLSNKYGASGATIVHGRGGGVPEEDSTFDLAPKEEKDIVIILAKKEIAKKIVDRISNISEFENGENSFIFTRPIRKTVGLDI